MGGVGFLTTHGVGFFCPTPTPDVQLDHFLHHTRKLGLPVEMVQFLLKLLLKQGFLLCTTISIDFKTNLIHFMLRGRSRVGNFGKVESEILERLESDTLPPTPQPW